MRINRVDLPQLQDGQSVEDGEKRPYSAVLEAVQDLNHSYGRGDVAAIVWDAAKVKDDGTTTGYHRTQTGTVYQRLQYGVGKRTVKLSTVCVLNGYGARVYKTRVRFCARQKTLDSYTKAETGK